MELPISFKVKTSNKLNSSLASNKPHAPMLDSQRGPGNAEHRFAIAVTVADNKRFKKHLPKNIIPHYPSSGQMMCIIGGLTEAVPI